MGGSSTPGPVFVVGQPRSGSTLLTRILNETSDLFVINDFYVLQKIDAANLWGKLSSAQAQEIGRWIYERIHIRATADPHKSLSQSIEMTAAQLAELEALVASAPDKGLLWSDVLDRVMSAAARLAGYSRWGHNTPQDYLHLDRLFSAFPEAKAVFLLREPRGLLRSYKNARGPWHDARRYNPTAIGLAWSAAARTFLRLKDSHPGHVLLITYSELVEETTATLAKLEAFLETSFSPVDLQALGDNSSHGDGRSQGVTESEVWLATQPMGTELRALGLDVPQARFKLGDLPSVAAIYARSALFHLRAAIVDPDRRKRILRLLSLSANRDR